MKIRRLLPLLLLPFLPAALDAQTPLPLGSTAMGETGVDTPAEYAVEVDGPGFLTVVVRSVDGTDVRIQATDADGQPLPGGEADQDLNGDLGAEQLLVELPRAGTYRIFVESYEMEVAAFAVGGGFLASQLAARAEDPDGSPSSAVALEPGETRNDTLDPAAGDRWDWFAFTAEEAGSLTVLTRTEEGDLGIRVYRAEAYREPVLQVDDDQGGVLGNESATVDVEAGETIYIRVGHPFERGGALGYTLRSGFIPG